jgi:hypothetical protein
VELNVAVATATGYQPVSTQPLFDVRRLAAVCVFVPALTSQLYCSRLSSVVFTLFPPQTLHF